MKFQNVKNVLEFTRQIPDLLEENKIMLLVMDGLGTTNISLKGFKKEVYRTVFPASTPTFFYSFHSLLYPKDHGFLEWYMRFRNAVVTIPPWKRIDGKKLRLKKKDVFPFKSLFQIIWKKGFSSVYYTPFANSIFTKYASKKAKRKKINFLSQIFPLEEVDFTFIYWPSADLILHERYQDEAFKVEIQMFRFFIELLKKRISKKSLFFVLSDHGLTKCEKRYSLPTIDSKFPVGGGRVAFYKDVEKERVEKEIRKRKIPAEVFELKELEDFKGKINPRCYENFGNIVVIAREKIAFKYPFEPKREKHVGFHGGISKEEDFINIWMYKKH